MGRCRSVEERRLVYPWPRRGSVISSSSKFVGVVRCLRRRGGRQERISPPHTRHSVSARENAGRPHFAQSKSRPVSGFVAGSHLVRWTQVFIQDRRQTSEPLTDLHGIHSAFAVPCVTNDFSFRVRHRLPPKGEVAKLERHAADFVLGVRARLCFLRCSL